MRVVRDWIGPGVSGTRVISMGGLYLASYQLHLTFCFSLLSDFKPGVFVPLGSVNWLFGSMAWFSLRVREVLVVIPLLLLVGNVTRSFRHQSSERLFGCLVSPLQDSFSRGFAPVFQPWHVSMHFRFLVPRAACWGCVSLSFQMLTAARIGYSLAGLDTRPSPGFIHLWRNLCTCPSQLHVQFNCLACTAAFSESQPLQQ